MPLFEANIIFDNEHVETGHIETKDLLDIAKRQMLLAQAPAARFGPIPWEVSVKYSDDNKRWEWVAKRAQAMNMKAELQQPKLQMPPSGFSKN